MDKGFPTSSERAVFLSDAHLNQDDIHSRNFLSLVETLVQRGDIVIRTQSTSGRTGRFYRLVAP